MIPEFARPSVLLLLVLPAALLAWNWRRQGRTIVLPWDHGRIGPQRRLRWPLELAESLPALLLAVVIVVLAGPLQLSQPKDQRRLTNIEFCVDVSGSMTAPLGDGTRYDGSMAAISDFLSYREGDAFGLTFFGNSVLHWSPLTSDVSALRCAPPFMRPEVVPDWFGGTEIAKALLACRRVLTERQEGDRMIVLVSDGYSSDLDGGHDMEVARALRDSQIRLYTIHVADGDAPGEIVNMAHLTGGEVFEAGDPDALRSIFRTIDEMQKAPIDKSAPEPIDDFFASCLAGLSVAAASLLCSFGLRYTPW